MSLEKKLADEVQTIVPWANSHFDTYAQKKTPQMRIFVERDLEYIHKNCSRAAYYYYEHIYHGIKEYKKC